MPDLSIACNMHTMNTQTYIPVSKYAAQHGLHRDRVLSWIKRGHLDGASVKKETIEVVRYFVLEGTPLPEGVRAYKKRKRTK